MAWQLYRLGRWCFRRRGRVLVGWVLLLAMGAVGAATLSGATSDSFELEGIESTEAFDLIEDRSPDATTDGATARLVVEATGVGATMTTPRAQEVIAAAIETATTEHVASTTDPFATGAVSEKGNVAYATISYDRASSELSTDDRDALEDAVTELEDAGYNAAITGDAAPQEAHGASAELVGIAIAFLVLALTFGSLVAAGMPLVTAVIGVGIGLLGITTLSGFVELSSVTPALASMLGLAVGIDYALFIMSRYKHEVEGGRSPEEAAGRAIGTAGSAVVFAGLTVVIALAGLSVTGISFLTQMGLAGAATVAFAVLIALTLLPALLGFMGHRVTGGQAANETTGGPEAVGGATGAEDRQRRTLGRRYVDAVTRRRWPVLVAGVIAAGIASIPVLSMELALPDDGSKPGDDSARVAYDLVADNFGPGANGPLVVVVDTAGVDDPAAKYEAVQRAVEGIETLGGDHEGIASISPTSEALAAPETQARIQQSLEAVDFAVVNVIPDSAPTSLETKDVVADLRDEFDPLPEETGARALVTGSTAVGIDIAGELAGVFPIYLVLVVGLAFILLVMVFRSLLVPLKAAVGFLLSLGVSLGATVAVFQWGWLQDVIGLDATAPVVFILPLLLTGVLFGLAMDYEVFLVTRMREEYVHGTEARLAVNVGYGHTARVVTAAALIMIGVFAGFAGGHDPIIKTVGFALAVGIVMDAFVVRMTLVPAVMAIIGDRMWALPHWLHRLPNLDVEGESLTRRLAEERAPAAP